MTRAPRGTVVPHREGQRPTVGARRANRPAVRVRPFVAALLAVPPLLLPAGRCLAQTEEPARPATAGRLEAVVRDLEPDQRLRLQLSGTGQRLEGRYLGPDDDGSLRLTSGERVVRAPLVEIDGLWTRGRSTVKGAAIGGIAGLVGGALYGAAISEVTCAESSCTTLGLMAAVGGLGAAGGAAVGALVGLAIPSWKLRFP